MRETGLILMNATYCLGAILATFLYENIDNYKDVFLYGLSLPFLLLNITYFFVVESPTYNL